MVLNEVARPRSFSWSSFSNTRVRPIFDEDRPQPDASMPAVQCRWIDHPRFRDMELEVERSGSLDRLGIDARRLVSECWIYTEARGLRAVTLHGNGSTIALDGERLRRWTIRDAGAPDVAVALVYSADMPTSDLERSVARAARERFAREPHLPAPAHA
jgi:hypothetical protein